MQAISSVLTRPLRPVKHLSRPADAEGLEQQLDALFARAFQHHRNGHWPQTDALCRRILEIDPTYWFAYSLEAAALFQLGQDVDALIAVERALEYEATDPKLLRMRDVLKKRMHSSRRPPAGLGPQP